MIKMHFKLVVFWPSGGLGARPWPESWISYVSRVPPGRDVTVTGPGRELQRKSKHSTSYVYVGILRYCTSDIRHRRLARIQIYEVLPTQRLMCQPQRAAGHPSHAASAANLKPVSDRDRRDGPGPG